MKRNLIVTTTLITLLSLGAEAFAAAGVREDGSMYIVWAFLGMCALIILLQLLPAMFLFYGLVKGLLTGSRQSQVEAQTIRED